MQWTRFRAASVAVAWAAILVPSILTAQVTFQRTYGGASWDEGYSVQPTTDGGYIISGYTWSFGAGNWDVWLIKTDAHGDTLWTRTYGGSDWEEGYSVQQTNDGGYIITGYTGSFGAGAADVYLIKTDASGSATWAKAYGGDLNDDGYSVQQTSDGGYIVAGMTWSFAVGSINVWLIKTNASGDTAWARTYYCAGWDVGSSVQQTADGGFIVAGYTNALGGVYLVKTNGNGDTTWTRTYGGNREDEGSSAQQTSDSGYVITGVTRSFGSGDRDVYLIKTNASGDTMWTRTYGATGEDRGNCVQQTADGGFIVTGHTDSYGAGNADVYLIKTDSRGDTLWTRTYGGQNYDVGYSVRQTLDGGYVVVGSTAYNDSNFDVYLIKTDSVGHVGVAEECPGPQTPGRKLAATVVRSLARGTVAFDAMGRQAHHPKPGVYFVKAAVADLPRKVLLVE